MCYQTAVMASPDLSSWILRLDHPPREGSRRKPGRTVAYVTGERLSLGKPPVLYQAVSKPLLCPRRRHHGCMLQTQTREVLWLAHNTSSQVPAEYKTLSTPLSPERPTRCDRNRKFSSVPKIEHVIFSRTCCFLSFLFTKAPAHSQHFPQPSARQLIFSSTS